MISRLHVLLVPAAQLIAPALLSAQLSGRVIDESGVGIPAAAVEIWSAHGRLSKSLTTDNGSFFFSQHAGAVRLTASSIGFRSHAVQITSTGADPLTIVLQRQVIALPQLMVDAKPRCPVRDSREARAHMRAAASRYAMPASHISLAAKVRMLNAYVRSPGPGAIVDSALKDIRYSSEQETTLEDSIRMRGFSAINHLAFTTGSAALERFAWSYPELDGRHAYLFVSPVFLELHSFTHGSRAAAEQEIIFCPKSRSKPGIEGAIVLAQDTSIATASWSFSGGSREGDHGGEAVFAPLARDSASSPLVSVRGSYWYRLNDTTFAQRTALTLDWRIGPAPYIKASEETAIYKSVLDHLISSKLLSTPLTVLQYPRTSSQASNSARPRQSVHPAIEPLTAGPVQVCKRGLAADCVVPIGATTVLEFGALDRPGDGTARVEFFTWKRADYISGGAALRHEALLEAGPTGWHVVK